MPVRWPGWNTGAWFNEAAKPQTVGRERYWLGSLSVGMRDASGQMYMRNCYYNPQTGQFTQPDPIGLAGGLNSYGFAAGDPVSYSDPYGLSATGCCDWLKQKWAAWNRYLDRIEARQVAAMAELTGGDVEAARDLMDFGMGMGMMSAGTFRVGRARVPIAGTTNLVEQLAAGELIDGVRAGAGVILGHRVPFRAAQGFAKQYGGAAADWVKKSTTNSVRVSSGDTYQIHWAENVQTGQIVDVKLKVYPAPNR